MINCRERCVCVCGWHHILFPIGKIVVIGHKISQLNEAIDSLLGDFRELFNAELKSSLSITRWQL